MCVNPYEPKEEAVDDSHPLPLTHGPLAESQTFARNLVLDFQCFYVKRQ